MSAEGDRTVPDTNSQKTILLIKALTELNIQFERISTLAKSFIDSNTAIAQGDTARTAPDSIEIEAYICPEINSLFDFYSNCLAAVGLKDMEAYFTEIAKLSEENELVRQAVVKQDEGFEKYCQALADLEANQYRYKTGDYCKSEVFPTDINMIDARTDQTMNLKSVIESTNYTVLILIRHFY